MVVVNCFHRMVRLIADEFLTEERDRKYYADHYRCWPPPLFVIAVTLVQVSIFLRYALPFISNGFLVMVV